MWSTLDFYQTMIPLLGVRRDAINSAANFMRGGTLQKVDDRGDLFQLDVHWVWQPWSTLLEPAWL